MLRVVIAEDEELIRRGLEREIPWASLGMQVTGLAANGREALKLCQEGRADILLTDIRMPLMDGLELIERVRRQAGDVVCLIISGYHDFEYAQKAISLGVSHYFLKPLELDQVEARLREVGARILEERHKREDQELIGHFVSNVLPFVRRQYFLEQIYGPYGDRDVARQLAELGAVREGSCCAAVLIQVVLEPGFRRNRTVETRVSRQLCNRFYDGEDIYLLKRSGGEAQFVAILVGEDPEQLARRRDGYLGEVRLLPFTRAAAGGGTRQGLGRLHESFVEARKELLLHSLLERSGLSAPGGERRAATDTDLAGVQEAMAADDLERLTAHLDSLEAALMNPPASEGERSAALVGLFGVLSRMTAVHGIDLEAAFRWTEGGAEYERGDATLGDIFSTLKRVALETVSSRSTRRELPARHLIDKARRYIEARCTAWDLTLEDVAEHVGLNPSYFSTLFKSVTQVNYIDYLTGLRMDNARRLLKDSQLKIAAVARMVGFQAPGYFGYLFKKHVGVTPSQYKAGLEA